MKHWVRILYNSVWDAYDLQTSVDDGKTWTLHSTYGCVAHKGASDYAEAEYVHYSLVTTLNDLMWTGYQYWPYGENLRD